MNTEELNKYLWRNNLLEKRMCIVSDTEDVVCQGFYPTQGGPLKIVSPELDCYISKDYFGYNVCVFLQQGERKTPQTKEQIDFERALHELSFHSWKDLGERKERRSNYLTIRKDCVVLNVHTLLDGCHVTRNGEEVPLEELVGHTIRCSITLKFSGLRVYGDYMGGGPRVLDSIFRLRRDYIPQQTLCLSVVGISM